jgi:RNA polymerase sigma factor (sigma-70 family)
MVATTLGRVTVRPKQLRKKPLRQQGKQRPNRRAELHRQRAEQIRDLLIEFVPHPLFEQQAAEAAANGHPLEIETLEPAAPLPLRPSNDASDRPAGARGYMASLYDTPLLTRDEEAALFRRLNYVKYRATVLRATLDPARLDVPLLDDIELLLAEADRTRNQIWRANLRLVVSIAKRYVNPENCFEDLVSDGNMSLLRAIECFDISRGYRFSTYATWAIRKNFHRAITKRHRDRTRFATVDESLLVAAPDRAAPAGPPQQAGATRHALARLLDRLPDRERLVVSARFGFDAGEHPQTLQQIADRLGVCKERSRQLLLRALGRLQSLAEETGLEPFDD